MNKISIKTRITLWYTLIILIISVAALFIMVSVSRDMLINDSKEKLVRSVEHIIPIVNAPDRDNNAPDIPPPNNKSMQKNEMDKLPGFRFFNDGVHTAVYDEDGNIVNGAIPFEFASEISFENEVIQEKVFNGNSHLTYTKEIGGHDGNLYRIVGVISIANESVLLNSVTKTNLILIVILILVAALGGYLILRQAFKPVEKIRNTAKSISESRDLSQRIALSGGKDEIHRLADTFDEMLGKIEKTLNNEKQFTSDASHELRTPVAVISSECEYTLECAGTLDEAKESVLSIKQQADKMSKLISELLAISRMDKNTMETTLENVDVSELLNFVCDEQEEIHTRDITLKRNIMPNVCVETDSMLLARIFINLISNAYSYGKENGNIEVVLYDRGKDTIIEISDNGIGISKENLPKIWERFYQVNMSRNNTDGSMGLGLSMVKMIADKLGADISVRSKLGEGTSFIVILPKIKPDKSC
ncbi:MAG: HAMP domain-containing sensor histidine kinase [Clostridia bacterium]|nr:HAMP domain-containing sensor histidine kinase [Clostridia bacterium]